MTSFLSEHPGGKEVLLALAGTDATNAFEDVGKGSLYHKITYMSDMIFEIIWCK